MIVNEPDGAVTFRVYLPDAELVEVVGTFTEWRSKAVRMVRERSGWWIATVTVAQGDHDFSYLVNGSTWLPDYAAYGVRRNGFGGWVSQLHVAQPPAVAACSLQVVVPANAQSTNLANVQHSDRELLRAA